jgi:hypothetical protein
MHGWAVFKMFQEQACKASIDGSESFIPTYGGLPHPSVDTNIAKAIAKSWMTLSMSEIAEWEELARDIRAAYSLLTSSFGNGAVFEGSQWEEERLYHARSIYLKWLGTQSAQAMVDETNSMTYAPVDPMHPVSFPFQIRKPDLSLRFSWTGRDIPMLLRILCFHSMTPLFMFLMRDVRKLWWYS